MSFTFSNSAEVGLVVLSILSPYISSSTLTSISEKPAYSKASLIDFAFSRAFSFSCISLIRNWLRHGSFWVIQIRHVFLGFLSNILSRIKLQTFNSQQYHRRGGLELGLGDEMWSYSPEVDSAPYDHQTASMLEKLKYLFPLGFVMTALQGRAFSPAFAFHSPNCFTKTVPRAICIGSPS